MTRDVETLKRSPYFPSFTECIIPANNDGNTNHNRVTEIINSNNCYLKRPCVEESFKLLPKVKSKSIIPYLGYFHIIFSPFVLKRSQVNRFSKTLATTVM